MMNFAVSRRLIALSTGTTRCRRTKTGRVLTAFVADCTKHEQRLPETTAANIYLTVRGG